VDQLAEFAADADSVRLAAWFHDAVYDPERSENEERSARLAERVLTELLVPSAVVEETARLVRLTADHAPDRGDANAAVLCDADLAVLAGTPEEYAAYAAAVREEYGFVPDEDFRVGRGAVLELLLAQRELFRTPPGAASWAEPARANLRAELDRLRGKVPPIG
jgi:predicted metal-dependent HD superfamily phosphohydrolase